MFDYEIYVKETIFSPSILWLYLDLLAHINVSERLAVSVLRHLSSMQKEVDWRRKSDVVLRFVNGICINSDLYSTDVSRASKLVIDCLLGLFIIEKERDPYLAQIVNNLAFICKQSGDAYNNPLRITELTINKERGLLIELVRNMGEEAQRPVRKIFSCWMPEENKMDYSVYCEAVLSRIIEPDRDIENRIFEWSKKQADKFKEKKPSLAAIQGLTPDSILNELINLYLSGLIIDVEGLHETVNHSEDNVSQWLMNLGEFDYSLFDCRWLKKCKDGLLKLIADNETAREQILKRYKSQYLSERLPEGINDIIVHFFIE